MLFNSQGSLSLRFERSIRTKGRDHMQVSEHYSQLLFTTFKLINDKHTKPDNKRSKLFQ
jgi:hypothetical protein